MRGRKGVGASLAKHVCQDPRPCCSAPGPPPGSGRRSYLRMIFFPDVYNSQSTRGSLVHPGHEWLICRFGVFRRIGRDNLVRTTIFLSLVFHSLQPSYLSSPLHRPQEFHLSSRPSATRHLAPHSHQIHHLSLSHSPTPSA